MEYEPLIPLAALEHFEYCPRQCALIHVDGEWADNRHTVAGRHGHRRADSGEVRTERGATAMRSVPLWHDGLGLIGRADVVEFRHDGRVVPVEYKIGTRHGLAADIQLCAQALCLEEMLGIDIEFGFVWTSRNRKRRPVPIDESLRQVTLKAIADTRAVLGQARLPPPADDERCRQCQFLERCMPDTVRDCERAEHFVREEVYSCGSSTRCT